MHQFCLAHYHPISNNPSFHQKYPCVLVGSHGSDGTLYPLTEKFMLPVTHAMGCVAYIPSVNCAQIPTIRTARVLHSSQGLQLICSRLHNAWQWLCLFRAKCHIVALRYCYILDAPLCQYMFIFKMLSLNKIQSSLRIHCLPLPLLRHYRILHV
jgi:hypothetical protein